MQIEWTKLAVEGCHAARLSAFTDARGSFQKLYHADAFAPVLPGFTPAESYISASEAGVLRGMHFQLPPHDHDKVVVCLSGHVLDAVLDLRAGPGYGTHATIELTPDGTNCVAIPKGVAHGFLAKAPGSTLLYLVGTVHNAKADAGVLWSSFGLDWDCADPILSERDTKHPALADFKPPRSWSRAPVAR